MKGIAFSRRHLLTSSSALAYETMEVTNGGSIEDTVEYAGATVPKHQIVEMIPENSFCGVKLPAGRYVIKDR